MSGTFHENEHFFITPGNTVTSLQIRFAYPNLFSIFSWDDAVIHGTQLLRFLLT